MHHCFTTYLSVLSKFPNTQKTLVEKLLVFCLVCLLATQISDE